LFNFFGTVMFTVTNRSPAACLPAAGTPRPRTRIVVPGCVPAAIFKVTGSSSVGTSTVVPSMTAVSGTFTDVGTTYKLCRAGALARLLPHLDRRVNLEFNAHFLDTALDNGIDIVECPITFFARVGKSKGGNVNNTRALKVGLRSLLGESLVFMCPTGWCRCLTCSWAAG